MSIEQDRALLGKLIKVASHMASQDEYQVNTGMTTDQRLELLERKVNSLIEIASRHMTEEDYCTCGTSAVCQLHGLNH